MIYIQKTIDGIKIPHNIVGNILSILKPNSGKGITKMKRVKTSPYNLIKLYVRDTDTTMRPTSPRNTKNHRPLKKLVPWLQDISNHLNELSEYVAIGLHNDDLDDREFFKVETRDIKLLITQLSEQILPSKNSFQIIQTKSKLLKTLDKFMFAVWERVPYCSNTHTFSKNHANLFKLYMGDEHRKNTMTIEEHKKIHNCDTDVLTDTDTDTDTEIDFWRTRIFSEVPV